MIARIIIPILLAIVLPDLYIYIRYLHRSTRYGKWMRLVWWMPAAAMVAYSVAIASTRNFVPDEIMFVNVYFMFVGILVVPKALFAVCSSLGNLYCRITHSRRNVGNLIWIPFALVSIYIIMYGFIIGFGKLEVRHIDIFSADLPEAFDGYRIVHFSDAHVGSFCYGNSWLLKRDIDTILAQKADMVVFTGDIQNLKPSELYRALPMLAKVRAPDGVYSVLGNHDYGVYVDADDAEQKALTEETARLHEKAGWQLLRNAHRTVRRGNDSIVVAGTENGGRKPSPDLADIGKSLEGTGKGCFVVMLQHDPAVWKEKIVPDGRAQLTLSGHTHAGQVSLFGLRPTMLVGNEDYGLYRQGAQQLYVTSGIGGLLAMRFGSTAEIVVVTLRCLGS